MIKLFTHTDLDGVGCAILAKLAFGKEVNIEYCGYDDVNEKVEKFVNDKTDEDCFITDISISDELASKIESSGEAKYFLLFDHHPTAVYLNKYLWCTVQLLQDYSNFSTSGTELYYTWLAKAGYLKKTTGLNRFVKLVTDYDTWRWKDNGEEGLISKKVNDLLYLYGRDKFIEWCLGELIYDIFPKFRETETTVLEIRQKEIEQYIDQKNEQMTRSNLDDHTCGVVFAERFFSELGNRLCERNSDIDFVIMIDPSGKVSLRTIKDDIDVGEIAKKYGGGGHAKAAGFHVDCTDFYMMLDTVIK